MNKTIFISISLSWVTLGFGDSGFLTLDHALETAWKNSPEMQAARLYSDVAKKELRAAGLWENPLLKLEA